MARQKEAHPIFARLIEDLLFLLDQQQDQSSKVDDEQSQQLKDVLLKEIKPRHSHLFYSPAQGLPPFYLDIIKAAQVHFGSGSLFCQQVRSLFRPVLEEFVEYYVPNEDAAELGDESDDALARRKRRSAASSAAVKKPIAGEEQGEDEDAEIKSFSEHSGRCLVKTLPDGHVVYSSLPAATLNNHEKLTLDESTSEMEILPISYGHILKSSKQQPLLKDISPAVLRPTHISKTSHHYKRRRDELKVPVLLDNGYFASFAPTFDSTDSEVNYSDLLMHFFSCSIVNSQVDCELASLDRVAPSLGSTAVASSHEPAVDLWAAMVPNHVKAKKQQNGHAEPNGDMNVDADNNAEPEYIEDSAAYLAEHGIDLDNILNDFRKEPTQATLQSTLSTIQHDLDLLMGLQHDRVESVDLHGKDFLGVYSLTVPAKSTSIHPQGDVRDLSHVPNIKQPTSNPKVDNMLKPSLSETKVYNHVVQNLIKCIDKVPVGKLMDTTAIDKLEKEVLPFMTCDDFNQPGILPPPSNPNAHAPMPAYPFGMPGFLPPHMQIQAQQMMAAATAGYRPQPQTLPMAQVPPTIMNPAAMQFQQQQRAAFAQQQQMQQQQMRR